MVSSKCFGHSKQAPMFYILWFGNCFGLFSKTWAHFLQPSGHPARAHLENISNFFSCRASQLQIGRLERSLDQPSGEFNVFFFQKKKKKLELYNSWKFSIWIWNSALCSVLLKAYRGQLWKVNQNKNCDEKNERMNISVKNFIITKLYKLFDIVKSSFKSLSNIVKN